MGMAAAAGWATSPSAEVQPEDRNRGGGGAWEGCRAWQSQPGEGRFCAMHTHVEFLQQPSPWATRGRSLGHPQIPASTLVRAQDLQPCLGATPWAAFLPSRQHRLLVLQCPWEPPCPQ